MNKVKINIETIKKFKKQEEIIVEALDAFQHLNLNEHPEEIIEQLYILLGFVERITNYELKVKVTEFLMTYSYIVVNLPDAEHFLESIISSESFNSNDEVLMNSFYLLTNVILNKNECKRALSYANMALFFANKTKNNIHMFNALTNLYVVYEELNDEEQMNHFKLKIINLVKLARQDDQFKTEHYLISYLITENWEDLKALLAKHKTVVDEDFVENLSTCLYYNFAKLLEKSNVPSKESQYYLFKIYNQCAYVLKLIQKIPFFKMNSFIFNSHLFKKRLNELLNQAIEVQQGITLNTIEIVESQDEMEQTINMLIEKLGFDGQSMLFYQTLLDEIVVILLVTIQSNFEKIVKETKQVAITNIVVDEHPNETTLVKLYEALNKLYLSNKKG